jgi:hypothetical protein
MDLIEAGNWGYRIGGLGIVAFTIVFLVAVRWRTDVLGRLLAAVFIVISAIFLTGGYRTLYPGDSGGFLLWRMVLYVSFALTIWAGFVSFIWSQFFAPRIKNRTTRRRNDEEGNLAGRGPDPDGGADLGPAGNR